MGYILNALFIVIYTLLVSRFGPYLEWNDIKPEFFLPLALIYFHHSNSTIVLLLVFTCGLCSDLLGGHQFTQQGLFFSALFLIIHKVQMTSFFNWCFIYLPTVFLLSCLNICWEYLFAGHQLSFAIIFTSAFLTTTYSLLLFYFAKLIRLGWYCQSQSVSLGVING
ncbi:MAG: hypothetical protein HQL32_07385 [Planctomycetes bacterium]|nr:hypothetical protein [Planctomycetota bacterium]